MINMKRSPKEKTMLGDGCCEIDRPEYPYGLCISLDRESLDKLGITTLPAVGEKLQLTALVTVQSVSEYERQDEGASRDVGLQITDMALSKPADERNARDLYPNSSMS